MQQASNKDQHSDSHYIGILDKRLVLLVFIVIAGLVLSFSLLISVSKTTESRDQLRDVSQLLLKTQDLQIQYNIARDAITTFMFLGSNETWRIAVQQTEKLVEKANNLSMLDNQNTAQQDASVKAVTKLVKAFYSTLPELKTIRQSPRGVVSGIVSSSINQASSNYAVISGFSQIVENLIQEDDNSELLLKTLKVQRLWLRMIAEFRAMLLIRNRNSQETAKVFIEQFQIEWERYLQDFDNLDFYVQELVEDIDKNQRSWIANFPSVVEVHLSKRWRLDLRYMEESVNPITASMLVSLNHYENNLNERIKTITFESRALESATITWVFVVMGLLTAFSVTMLIIYKRLLVSQQRKRIDAERINNLKTDFLSTISHELRTPLNAILGFGQLIAMNNEKTLTEQQKSNIEEVNLAATHLLHLVNEILDISSIESGNIKLNIHKVDLTAILEESLSISSKMAEESDISIDNQSAQEGDCYVNADPLRLRQIFINLITNAVKYNRKNGSIRINIERSPDKFRVNIKDTGHGINKDDLEKLFQPFERLNRGYEIDGSGIGLAVTKGLIQSMNGNIGVNSKPGKGSTFWIELPAS